MLKVASRCNLDCDYCYVYHLADQSWRAQPRFMSDETVAATAERIAEHARVHGLDAVSIRLHGGEPLLAGPERLGRIVGALRARLSGLTEVAVTVQTNGVLLDEAMAAFLVDEDIGVGVSLDGDRYANDLHRTYLNGRSSYDEVVAGIAMMRRPEFRSHFLGLLCTVQLAADPVRVWDSLLDLEVPTLDFLLPHGTWERPPPGLEPGDARTPYADWLIPLFDRWFDAPARPVAVRTFESLLHLSLGGRASHESFGLGPIALVVVETDGSYEQVDSMKAVDEGAAATGRGVFTDPLDALFALPTVTQRQLGLDALGERCRACEIVSTCGGGLFPHRYRPGTGFTNPSVYCADLYALITHIQRRLEEALERRGTSLAAIRAS
ncbi:FxsB family radical SAM/SPASM domain protein [Frankia sp. CNm7]|uniref:FxsB family radical SAM/SPASM domain protein n=1 Tax=Frankia nepalensis TaxID=1836974 RepID=A0A937RKF3_9ACTN|nr:FxsB family cyclophane-forming radical SAM/SPASM peptide maturase [Frankia nepalensis]MBL7497075.1 FxsB family radical SAM/SPASM domain protein [Frankia nepalensis]MBL7514821.1 FxsB family radical SAM/SPASM domain protein [Frankia nepalensis]MBL7518874.1 FxsB family radical SAM/SPASM domain protein [Frankia nepalensis]MBL7628058.1 FxsB family radical SAM/SPASM domain protein [Frankia nepalensis]